MAWLEHGFIADANGHVGLETALLCGFVGISLCSLPIAAAHELRKTITRAANALAEPSLRDGAETVNFDDRLDAAPRQLVIESDTASRA